MQNNSPPQPVPVKPFTTAQTGDHVILIAYGKTGHSYHLGYVQMGEPKWLWVKCLDGRFVGFYRDTGCVTSSANKELALVNPSPDVLAAVMEQNKRIEEETSGRKSHLDAMRSKVTAWLRIVDLNTLSDETVEAVYKRNRKLIEELFAEIPATAIDG